MTQQEYRAIEAHMLSLTRDSAHDSSHVYRVLYTALDIAQTLPGVDWDVLIAACLLHDIGRERQFQSPGLCHARVGGDMAYAFLRSRDWPEEKAAHARDCVASHRYRRAEPPRTAEAKILYDADKLDVCGAIGMARSFLYAGVVSEPIYLLDEEGKILLDGGGAEVSSFFQEYHYKLKRMYDGFHTRRAREIGEGRRRTAEDFYRALYAEVSGAHGLEAALLDLFE